MSIFFDSKDRFKQSWRDHPQKKRRFKKIGFKKASNFFGGRFFKNFSFSSNKTWNIRIFFYAIVFLIFFCLIGFIGGILWFSRGLPDPNKLMEREIAESTKIYDRTGENILYEISGNQKRTIIPLKEIPEYVKWATISIEDKDFYKHKGFSLWAIFRTTITNMIFGRKAGGSTLTQQFIKNAVFTTEKTYTRKIKELILSYRLEKKFSKDEILQMYFNEIPYGSTAYGIEAASQKYFGKSARDLTLAEAAILAALPQAPSKYSPYGPNRELLLNRQKYILDLMAKYGYITEEETNNAKSQEIKFKEPFDQIVAPHFVMYVKEILSAKYGEKTIEQGGLKIYTTLDLYKQKIAEETINEFGEKNEKKFNASNAALVAIDPKTGQILSMVGSRNYFNEKIDGQVNVTLASRQPGSSIKPIVYAAAFLKGYPPTTVLYDVVTNFSLDPSKPYEPQNYNGKENGPVTMSKALAGSLNISAVKTLYLAGIDNVFKLIKSLGYTTFSDKDKDRLGLSLVLGGGEVKLLEHVNAYAAFAKDGVQSKTSAILKIVDKNGKILEEFKSEEKKVIDSNIARMINGILSDNNERAYIFGTTNYLTLPNRPAAVKTGTTNDNRDAWTVGYTPSIVAGVWVGNNDNTPMKRGADGSVVAAPIWNTFMKKILGNTPVEVFKQPEIKKTGKPVLDGTIIEGIKVKIDKASGLLASSNTPESMIEEKIFKEVHSILYYIKRDDPLGESPKNPAEDPQFNAWESRVLVWAMKNNIATSSPPKEYSNLYNEENKPVLIINYPTDKQTITNSDLTVSITVTATRGIKRVEYYIDNFLFDNITVYPFNLQKDISFLKNGYHNLLVKACDDIDNCSSYSLDFNLSLPNNIEAGDISIKIELPTNNSVYASSSLPILIRASILNYKQTAKISFYANDKIINTLSLLSTDYVIFDWRPFEVGVYKLRASAWGWNGQKTESEMITINIK